MDDVLMRWINTKALRFLLLGFVFYTSMQLLFPEPKPQIGPLAQGRIDALVDEWQALMGRPMSDSERDSVLLAELDRDMLFAKALELELHLIDPVVEQRLIRNIDFLGLHSDQEDAQKLAAALAMRMHLGDEVIKRRLIQLAEEWLLLTHPPVSVTEQSVIDYFEANKETFWAPERYTLAHVFFPREREAEVRALEQAIIAESLTHEQALLRGAPFLPGYQFNQHTAEQLARQLGAGFVTNWLVTQPQPQTWSPPVASTFGWHLVWLSELTPGRALRMEEVRSDIIASLERQRRADALAEAKQALRTDYEMVL
jgi:hypothetical protein